MKILSLFDGMSVAQQALKDAGIPVEVYYASEIDPYAVAVTQSNFPNTIQLGSVVGLDLKEDIDLLIGGSPCQDLSIAKANREGLKGSRSGLFWEYVRIRDEVKPKYFILENVASMPKEAKEVISEALGVEPVMINASLVSAQNRKRLFWVGKWSGEKYEQVEIPQPEDRGILLKDILEEYVDEKYYLKDYNPSYNQDKPIDESKEKYKVLRVGGDNPTIRIGSLNSGGQGDRIYSKNGRGAKTGLYEVSGVASRTYPRTKIEGQPRSKQIEIRDDGKANAMTSVQGDSMIMIKIQDTVRVRKHRVDIEKLRNTLREHKNLSNKEIAEKLNQPITKVEHWFRTDSSFSIPDECVWFELKKLLNIQTDEFDKSITEFEIRDGRFDMSKRIYRPEGKAPTITTASVGQQHKIINDTHQIRKLTPTECLRLQSMPDDYFDKATYKNKPISNTQRYKMCGNAFNKEVIVHILKHLLV